MQRVEKVTVSAHKSMHSFPSIGTPHSASTGRQAESSHSFRPLYRSADPRKARGGSDHGQNKDAPREDRAEVIQAKFFSQGVEAGKLEACKVVQQELQGPLNQLIHESQFFERRFTEITESGAHRIVELAQAIALKVLGDSYHIDKERLAPMYRKLTEFMERTFRLSIKLNPSDLQQINEMLTCANPQWRPSEALKISEDGDIPQGQPNLHNEEETGESLKARFEKLLDHTLSSM